MSLCEPRVLILGSKTDLACDFVIRHLRAREAPYLRLNSEDLPSIRLCLDPVRRQLEVFADSKTYLLANDTLQSVWFRRPVYLREYGVPQDLQEQFCRIQWAAFLRSLMIFDRCTWVNHPVATYNAEHKAIQLAAASDLGFAIPRTVISNDVAHACTQIGSPCLAIKGVDTVLVRNEDTEVFGYTVLTDQRSLHAFDQASAPSIIQEALADKLDLRVTVIGDKVYTVSITVGGKGIGEDWRKQKDLVDFEIFRGLPSLVEDSCRRLLQVLGLSFGAIDLVFSNGTYYFLEVNPTGEWAWLIDRPGIPIDTAIAEYLLCSS